MRFTVIGLIAYQSENIPKKEGPKMAEEVTLVLIKPDAVERGLMGEILSRFERAGLSVVALKMLQPTRDQLEKFFPQQGEDRQKWIIGMGKKGGENFRNNGNADFLTEEELEPMALGTRLCELNFQYLSRGKLVAVALRGVSAIAHCRKLIGATIPATAAPGTIRGDYSGMTGDWAVVLGKSCENLVHGSDSPEAARRELAAFFGRKELSQAVLKAA